MSKYSLKKIENKKAFIDGIKAGIPIGLGYFAVSFSLGIMAKNSGLNPIQAFVVSLLNNASAGEYAGFTLIAAGATYVEVALMTFIANARYLLMSTAMSQRIEPGTSVLHRIGVAFDLADEVFAVSIARPGWANPNFTYGVISVALPGWSIGTAIGCVAGELMPIRLVSALSVALFGMFLSVIIPTGKKNKVVLFFIILSFALSFVCNYIPYVNALSEGTRTIILTVMISAIAAAAFPVRDEIEELDGDDNGVKRVDNLGEEA